MSGSDSALPTVATGRFMVLVVSTCLYDRTGHCVLFYMHSKPSTANQNSDHWDRPRKSQHCLYLPVTFCKRPIYRWASPICQQTATHSLLKTNRFTDSFISHCLNNLQCECCYFCYCDCNPAFELPYNNKLIYWLIDCWTDWLTDWLIDWLIYWFIDSLIDWTGRREQTTAQRRHCCRSLAGNTCTSWSTSSNARPVYWYLNLQRSKFLRLW